MSSSDALEKRIESFLPYVTVPVLVVVFVGTQLDLESSGTVVTYALTFLFGVPVVVGLLAVGLGLGDLRNWWAMRSLSPAGPTGEYEGLCEFEGVAHPVDGTVTTPFTGTDAVVCQHTIEKNRNGDASWETVRTVTESVPFEVEHTGPTVAVEPSEAQTLLGSDFQVSVSHDDDNPPAEVAKFVEELREETEADWELEHGGVSVAESEPELYRFTERRLDDGESVHVVGTVLDKSAAIPDCSTATMSITAQKQGLRHRLFENPFLLSDSDAAESRRRQLKHGAVKMGVGLAFVLLFSLFLVPALLDLTP